MATKALPEEKATALDVLREQLEAAHRKSHRLSALMAMGNALTATLDMTVLINRALRSAVELSGHDQGSLMLLTPGGRSLVIRAVAGQDSSRIGSTAGSLKSSIAGSVLRKSAPVYLEGRAESLPGVARSYTKDVPSSICLPLLTPQGKAVGVLSLNATRDAAHLTHEDIEVLQITANQVAIANAELYQSLQRKDQLLQESAVQLIGAQEEERRRVAYDLHDGLAQMIAGTHQRLQTYQSYRSLRSPEAKAELEKVQTQLKQCISEVRRIIGNLRPATLEDFGLETALRQYLAELQRETGWELEMRCRLGQRPLPSALETAAFRIVQEAAGNARNHARSPKLYVDLDQNGGWLRIEIRDWGRGFNPKNWADPTGPGQRVGLVGMSERAKVLGGRCRITCGRSGGTRVVARLPLAMR